VTGRNAYFSAKSVIKTEEKKNQGKDSVERSGNHNQSHKQVRHAKSSFGS
jgi:hypothetical protein